MYTETEGIRPSFSESISSRQGFPLPSSNSLLSAPEFPYKCSISSTKSLGFFSQRAPDENKNKTKRNIHESCEFERERAKERERDPVRLVFSVRISFHLFSIRPGLPSSVVFRGPSSPFWRYRLLECGV